MPPILSDFSGQLGLLLRAVGLQVFGFAPSWFFVINFKTAVWQVQIALADGIFGLLIALTDFAMAGTPEQSHWVLGRCTL